MPTDHFDERVAAGYDQSYMFDPGIVDPAVDFLADLADGRSALELGIGTGRIGLPLSARGVRVHGIDLSSAMVAQLQAKPGAEHIAVTIGDFATTTVGETFPLAYLVYNTIENLTSQDEQVQCFQNVADHLDPGGRFVIECEVPAIQRLPPGETVRAFDAGPTHLGFDRIDVATQLGTSYHYVINGDRVGVFSTPYRYAWPAELDLMARLAGLTLCERWAGWDRSLFTANSWSHVSVWQKPASSIEL